MFCGLGGFTKGAELAGVVDVQGIDLAKAAQHAYGVVTRGRFHRRDVKTLSADTLAAMWGPTKYRLLLASPPCQAFSTWQNTSRRGDVPSRTLTEIFAALAVATLPDFVVVENVPGWMKAAEGKAAIHALQEAGYKVAAGTVDASRFGVPQRRERAVVMASRHGMPSWPVDSLPPRTVRDAIADLPPIPAGGEDPTDPIHRCQALSPINLQRIRASKPGGTWQQWPDNLKAPRHHRQSSRRTPSVYGRMRWDEPAPTIDTQFYIYGTGRFGHPQQDRALSLREGMRLQGFEGHPQIDPPGRPLAFSVAGRLIGNAIPPTLAQLAVAGALKTAGLNPDYPKGQKTLFTI